MQLTGLKAAACATIMTLALAAPASAQWRTVYGWDAGYGWRGTYGPRYYGYYGGYGYYPWLSGGYGGLYPYSYYSYNFPSYYSTAPGYYAVTPAFITPDRYVAGPSIDNYQSFYPADSSALITAPTGKPGDTAVIRVQTAPNADLWFEGTETTQRGPTRTFSTPPLKPGNNYTYEVRVRWMENGKPMEKTRSVSVAAGQTVDVDLTPANLMRP